MKKVIFLLKFIPRILTIYGVISLNNFFFTVDDRGNFSSTETKMPLWRPVGATSAINFAFVVIKHLSHGVL